MAGSYFSLSETKVLLNITDTADDTLLNQFGAVANQNLDNVLEIFDEKIPNQGTNVLEDIKSAANFYVCSLYRTHHHNIEEADHWMKQYTQVLSGIKEQRKVDNPVYTVDRHNSRRSRDGHDHFFAEW